MKNAPKIFQLRRELAQTPAGASLGAIAELASRAVAVAEVSAVAVERIDQRLTRCLLDEGPGHSVIVDGPARVHRVVLNDCMWNVLGTGIAARFTNVERLHITGGLIGWAHQSTDAIRLENVGSAKLTEVRTKAGASSNRLVADAACRYLRVEDCDFSGGIFSDAALTIVETDGIAVVS